MGVLTESSESLGYTSLRHRTIVWRREAPSLDFAQDCPRHRAVGCVLRVRLFVFLSRRPCAVAAAAALCFGLEVEKHAVEGAAVDGDHDPAPPRRQHGGSERDAGLQKLLPHGEVFLVGACGVRDRVTVRVLYSLPRRSQSCGELIGGRESGAQTKSATVPPQYPAVCSDVMRNAPATVPEYPADAVM